MVDHNQTPTESAVMADPKLPHIHVSALDGIKTMFYVIIGFGLLHIIARRYPNNPLATTCMNVFC